MRKSLADRIEQYLKVLIEHSCENQIEIQRAELAETFCCVPSQVTYVISTRFTGQEGYITESRRGGKGYVRIVHKGKSLIDVSGALRELLSFLDDLEEQKAVNENELQLLRHLAEHGIKSNSPEEQIRQYQEFRQALENYYW